MIKGREELLAELEAVVLALDEAQTIKFWALHGLKRMDDVELRSIYLVVRHLVKECTE